jgi:hypothetical protein
LVKVGVIEQCTVRTSERFGGRQQREFR